MLLTPQIDRLREYFTSTLVFDWDAKQLGRKEVNLWCTPKWGVPSQKVSEYCICAYSHFSFDWHTSLKFWCATYLVAYFGGLFFICHTHSHTYQILALALLNDCCTPHTTTTHIRFDSDGLVTFYILYSNLCVLCIHVLTFAPLISDYFVAFFNLWWDFLFPETYGHSVTLSMPGRCESEHQLSAMGIDPNENLCLSVVIAIHGYVERDSRCALISKL